MPKKGDKRESNNYAGINQCLCVSSKTQHQTTTKIITNNVKMNNKDLGPEDLLQIPWIILE